MKAAKGKTHVALTLTEETRDRLLDMANDTGRTLAGYIRWVINDHLRQLDTEEKVK